MMGDANPTNEVMTYVRSLQKIPVTPSTDGVGTPIGGAKTIQDTQNGVPGTSIVREFELIQSVQDFAALDPNAKTLYPGSIIQGESVQSGQFTPVLLSRAPGTMTLTNINFSDPTAQYSAHIDSPSLATVQQALSQLLAQPASTSQPAQLSVMQNFVHSSEEFALRVNASYSWMSGNVKGFFDLSTKTERTSYMKRLIQRYYTASFTPDTADSFFAPDVTLADAQQYMGDDNPPLFVSSIYYGRSLYFLTVSERSETEVQAAVEAAFNAVGNAGSVKIEAKYKEVLDESSTYVLAIGGGGEDVAQIALGDVAGWAKYVTEGANYGPSSPAAPIAYQLAYVADQRPAVLSFTGKYKTTTFRGPSTQHIQIVLHTLDDDKDEGEAIEFWLYSATGAVIANLSWYEDVRFPEQTDITFDMDFTTPVPITDFSTLRLRLRKHPLGSSTGNGWNMYMEATVSIVDRNDISTTLQVLPPTRHRRVGDDHKYDINFMLVNPYDPDSREQYTGKAIEDTDDSDLED